MWKMNTERENLIKLLFPTGFPDDWNSNNLDAYLSELSQFKCVDLLKEPEKLQIEHIHLQQKTQDLAISNYPIFIETAQCSRTLFEKFTQIDSTLDTIIESTREFDQKCRQQTVLDESNRNLTKINSKCDDLVEILQLPHLMGDCIKEGLYEDALELAIYVRKLQMAQPTIEIFTSLVQDVDSQWTKMLNQLLDDLKSELGLPKCLQIVSILRRMQIFNEDELKLRFLQNRTLYLENYLKQIRTDDVNYHLNKTIEVTRVNLFNIITQYRAVFTNISDETASINHNDDSLFYLWINDQVKNFLNTLQKDLFFQSNESLESIVTQCMYFGQSFAKIGCDFRQLLVPIFTEKSIQQFQIGCQKSIRKFHKNLEFFTLLSNNDNEEYNNSKFLKTEEANNTCLEPPHSLLEFYPLAEFTNNILTLLNELKLCPPLGALKFVICSLNQVLMEISSGILRLYGQEQQAFTKKSENVLKRFLICFCDDLVPFLQRCIHVIYPPTSLATVLGSTVTNLQQENIGFLDKTQIFQPIQHLLPMKVENWENIGENVE